MILKELRGTGFVTQASDGTGVYIDGFSSVIVADSIIGESILQAEKQGMISCIPEKKVVILRPSKNKKTTNGASNVATAANANVPKGN